MPDVTADNSFADVDFADEYADGSMLASVWEGKTDDEKARALIEATRELDTLEWKGARVDAAQSLAWPRSGVVNLADPEGGYFDETEIPGFLQNATVELALGTLRENRAAHVGLSTSNVKRKKVDVLETEYFSPSEGGEVLEGLARFPRVLALIGGYLDSSAGGLEIIRV